MIRAGHREGWLALPVSAFLAWSRINGCTFDGIRFDNLLGRGSAVVADRDLSSDDQGPLLIVPRELILSRESVELQAKSDRYLRELLDALGDYGSTTRGAILVFLLHQATVANPHISERCGVLTPFAEYMKFLPEEDLPTFWPEHERELFAGTTLKPAVEAKLVSLEKEFANLKYLTQNVGWCARCWWDEDEGHLTFDDWMQVDSMYRSRALEYPGIGDAIVPCIDMANHASGEATAALYETDSQGAAILLLRDSKNVKAGQEVTITYGDLKGACEMIFSYGFLEQSMTSAGELFLDLQIPHDDPLAVPKKFCSTVAPGVKIYERSDGKSGCKWHSDYVWLISVNEEDGLDFLAAEKTDGSRDLHMLWNGRELHETTELRKLLEAHALWDVFQLRAVSIIQERVESQIQAQIRSPNAYQGAHVRARPQALAKKLRETEAELLKTAYSSLEAQKQELIESDVVRDYLAQAEVPTDAQEQEDFS